MSYRDAGKKGKESERARHSAVQVMNSARESENQQEEILLPTPNPFIDAYLHLWKRCDLELNVKFLLYQSTLTISMIKSILFYSGSIH